MLKHPIEVKLPETTYEDVHIYQVNDNPEENNCSLVWFGETAHSYPPRHFEWNIGHDPVWSGDHLTTDATPAVSTPANLAKPSLNERIPKTDIQKAARKYLDNAVP